MAGIDGVHDHRTTRPVTVVVVVVEDTRPTLIPQVATIELESEKIDILVETRDATIEAGREIEVETITVA